MFKTLNVNDSRHCINRHGCYGERHVQRNAAAGHRPRNSGGPVPRARGARLPQVPAVHDVLRWLGQRHGRLQRRQWRRLPHAAASSRRLGHPRHRVAQPQENNRPVVRSELLHGFHEG